MLLGSTVLEVAIGIVFVYLLMSLLCSAVCEYIEAKFNNRAKYLRQGINLLLNETKGGGADLAQLLYDHGLVRPLYRDVNKPPSYIPSRIFTLALWNIASTAAAGLDSGGNLTAAGVSNDLKKIREVIATQLPNPELRTALLTLIDEADGDIERARKNIEDWYDGMMDRVSGWYKRHTSMVLLALGFVAAAIVNADSINIAKALVRDGALRSSIVAAAEHRLATPLTAPPGATADAEARDKAATDNLREVRSAIDTLGLPIGWVSATADNAGDPRRSPSSAGAWILKIFGILLTGFAISQGAPFWFDILNKFMVIRSTVKPAEKSQEQPSKDNPAPSIEIGKNPDAEEPSKG